MSYGRIKQIDRLLSKARGNNPEWELDQETIEELERERDLLVDDMEDDDDGDRFARMADFYDRGEDDERE